MTPPNPSEAAREAAAQIFEEHPNVACDLSCQDEAASIIQAAIDSALTAERERRVELEKQRDRLSREVNDLRYELKEALRCGNLKGDDHG